MDITISLITTLVLTLINGYFSMSEMALTTAKRATTTLLHMRFPFYRKKMSRACGELPISFLLSNDDSAIFLI